MIVAIAASEGFGFALRHPGWLWWVPLIAFAAFCRHRRRAAVPMAATLVDGAPLPRSLRQRLWICVPMLEVLGLLAVGVALARPIERLPLPPERQGADVLLCVDTSSSMLATDLAVDQTRLAVAVRAASDFVTSRREDRIGLVTFARYADLRCPPTLDHEAAAGLLAAVQPVTADGPEDATGIGTALSFAADVLQRAATAAKVIVLLTDGEENVATTATPREIAPLHAAQLARGLGIRVHTIVVGTGSPAADGRFLPLDTTMVQQVAALTGGRFFIARDAAALRSIYRDIDALEKTGFVEPRVLTREWFAAFAGVGLLLVLGARWFVTHPRGMLP